MYFSWGIFARPRVFGLNVTIWGGWLELRPRCRLMCRVFMRDCGLGEAARTHSATKSSRQNAHERSLTSHARAHTPCHPKTCSATVLRRRYPWLAAVRERWGASETHASHVARSGQEWRGRLYSRQQLWVEWAHRRMHLLRECRLLCTQHTFLRAPILCDISNTRLSLSVSIIRSTLIAVRGGSGGRRRQGVRRGDFV